ncbi:MAG: putative metal-binding motif-containing protein [Deltaproteobacteria bacterium]|nr:putative metal-binding motif-containing protein [Deltaproteobacteria bacterium]
METTQKRAKRPNQRAHSPPRTLSFMIVLGLIAIFLLILNAPPVFAADCPDNDNDGYVVCDGVCTVPSGKACGDENCDDNDADVYPGATDICDGKDNDCDNVVDEDFVENQNCQVFINPCINYSILECDNGQEICPEPEMGWNTPEDELAYTAACHDGVDNDCDNDVDEDDSDCEATEGERCNGLDDDYNDSIDDNVVVGFNLGDPCEVGEGICLRQGILICGEDDTVYVCSATPGSPKNENTPGRCTDGLDNNCDGLTDLDDPECQEEEKCDGIDNDGDLLVDEDFKPPLGDLGDPCTVGIGACENTGIMVCSPDGMGTICSVVPGLASVEGPTGPTCDDTIDNDCDGDTDDQDSGCWQTTLSAWCALPYLHGRPGRDCTGWHEIQFGTDDENAEVTVELLALNENGEILNEEQLLVEYGDEVHLASRLDPDDWKWRSWSYGRRGTRTRHEVFAPVPMLRVTVKDDLNRTTQAYCSNIPYAQVIEPSGTVVSESEGDVTNVLVAIPLTDPSSLIVEVDGVDILLELGISDPSSECSPALPCNGTVMINSQSVEVSELVVQVSPIDVEGSNTLTMKLSNLGCGGHLIVVQGQKLPGSFPARVTKECHVDDLCAEGSSSGLAVFIDSPTENQVISSFPVTVEGQACSGREIVDLRINGKGVDIGTQPFTPLGVEGCDGETSVGTYLVDFVVPMDQTNLAQDVSSGDVPLITLDLGSNNLVGMVMDDEGNRSYSEPLYFAVGDVASPGTVPLRIQEQVFSDVKAQVKEAVQLALNATETEIENAFVVGITEGAVDTLFSEKCADATDEFKNKVREAINQSFATNPPKKKISYPCSCDPWVYAKNPVVTFENVNIACNADFEENQFMVHMDLPDLTVKVDVHGDCETEGIFGECFTETIIDGWAQVTVSNIWMEFYVTEDQLLGNPNPDDPNFDTGVQGNLQSSISTEINCWGAWFCDVFVTVFTLGFVDLTPDIDISTDLDIKKAVGAGEPDPVSLGEIKVAKEEVEEYGQELEGNLSSVEITANGIVAGLTGKFATTAPLDPEVQSTPGAVLTPAGLPTMLVPDAEDVFIALADDTINQLFASLTAMGGLKTGCQDSGKTVSDLIPVDCGSLSVGECSNDSSIACKEDADCDGGLCEENSAKTTILQGACYGFQGYDCDALPLGRKLACQAVKNKMQQFNINGSQPLLFCSRQDIPPRLLIQDDPGTTDWVETTLRLNDLSVAMVVDRNGNQILDGELTSIPKCFEEGSSTVGDCAFFALCLDLNLETAMQLAEKHCENDAEIICTSDSDCESVVGGGCVDVCEEGKPGFITRVNEIVITPRAAGVMCGGTTTPGDDEMVANEGAQNETNDILIQNATRFTPPICIEGLTLGDFVEFYNPRLIAIEADGDLDFQDYLGITGDVQAP